jgi:intracellular multiplication protein IcmL
MAEQSERIVVLKNDFYKDSFYTILLVIISLTIAVIVLFVISIYLYNNKPKPVYFATAQSWRVQGDVPVNLPYLSTPDLLQWTNNIFRQAFTLDFTNYDKQLNALQPYFTANGWQIFLNQINIYANANSVQQLMLFVNATPSGAPYILNSGLLTGKYAWWVVMPLTLNYISVDSANNQSKKLTLQVLVVRVSTMNNLTGVAIDNVIVPSSSQNPTQ